MSKQIDESQQFQLEHILKEKEELDSKVIESEQIRKRLAKEKDDLAQSLLDEKALFIKNQENQRKEFELQLSISREETIERQRKDFEIRLAKEKEVMELNQREAEAKLIAKSEEAERKIVKALEEKNRMETKMEEEKLKAESIIEEERIKYEKKVAELEEAFNNEKDNVNEYKFAYDKLNKDFEEKLRSGRKDFEEALAKEKADKEAEHSEKEKMKHELETKREEIHELKKELDRKRKRDNDEDNEAKKSRTEEKTRFLEKCNDELKCSICDDIFIEVRIVNLRK